MTHQNKCHSASDNRKRSVFYRSLVNFLVLSLFSSLLPVAQVLGSGAGQPEQSARETSGPQEGAVDEKEVRPLERGQSVKRELSGGQRHSYRLRLSANQFLKAI